MSIIQYPLFSLNYGDISQVCETLDPGVLNNIYGAGYSGFVQLGKPQALSGQPPTMGCMQFSLLLDTFPEVHNFAAGESWCIKSKSKLSVTMKYISLEIWHRQLGIRIENLSTSCKT